MPQVNQNLHMIARQVLASELHPQPWGFWGKVRFVPQTGLQLQTLLPYPPESTELLGLQCAAAHGQLFWVQLLLVLDWILLSCWRERTFHSKMRTEHSILEFLFLKLILEINVNIRLEIWPAFKMRACSDSCLAPCYAPVKAAAVRGCLLEKRGAQFLCVQVMNSSKDSGLK